MKRHRADAAAGEDEEKEAATMPLVLYVGSVHQEATADEVRQAFSAFHPAPDPDAVWISTQARGEKGRFGFLRVQTREDYDAALAAKPPPCVRGRRCYVTPSKARPTVCAACGEVVHAHDLARHTSLLHSDAAQRVRDACERAENTEVPEAAWEAFDKVVQTRLADSAPREGDARAREELLANLERAIGSFWRGARVEAFGSFATGLFEREDDLDMALRVNLTDASTGEPWAERGVLCSLRRSLVVSGSVSLRQGQRLALVLDARVPVLSFRPALSSELGWDLCVNRTLGVFNSVLLADYVACDARVRPFLRSLRAWARSVGVRGAKEGWLSSYSLCLLGIAFLQERDVVPNLQSEDRELDRGGTSLEGVECKWTSPGCARWKTSSPDSVAKLLVAFHKFCGCDFDFNLHALSIKHNKGVVVSRSELAWEAGTERRPGMCVLDPFESGYNTARMLTQARAKEFCALCRRTFVSCIECLSTMEGVSSAADSVLLGKTKDDQ